VIITADHGEQFNDNREGIWGHASDYNRWQLQVPLILYLPNEGGNVFNYYTTHYDIVPFIMRRFLGCSNAIQDYSIGASLFTSRSQLDLFAASYIDYAFVQNNRITRIYPNGNIRIYNNQGENIKGASLSPQMAKNFFKIMNEYYKAPKKA
jgi:membrane-anchored protein YejM (alkaline phosphatase superfamily)